MTDFATLGVSEPLLRALEKHDFTTPTEIQARAIPPLLDGSDLIGLAETGTGKTAAFLLPMLTTLTEAPINLEAGSPRALILAPTRELAQQIGQSLNQLSGYIHLRSTVIFGGAPMQKQIKKLKSGIDILVATPGRLMDHMRQGNVSFDHTEIFILDEADRMLDMGFIGDVQTIDRLLPKDHQTVLFSATINKHVEKLTKTLLNNPVRINVTPKVTVSSNVHHSVMHVKRDNKRTLLQKILNDYKDQQLIIFTKTKRGADALNRTLQKKGHRTDAIHGDRNQRQRQRTLTRFREGTVDILIATDVAARGIDVPGIACVINFDLPLEAESYVHRVGRTGRNGATGHALSFCTADDLILLHDIEKLIKTSISVDLDQPYHAEPPSKAPQPQKQKSRRRARPAGRTIDKDTPHRTRKKPVKPGQRKVKSTTEDSNKSSKNNAKPKRKKPVASDQKKSKATTGTSHNAPKPKRKKPTAKGNHTQNKPSNSTNKRRKRVLPKRQHAA